MYIYILSQVYAVIIMYATNTHTYIMNDESKVFLDAQTTTLARAATSPRVAAGRFRMRLLCSASGTGKTATRAGITGCGGSKTIPRSAIGTMLCSKMKCRSKGARGSLSSFFLQRSRRYLAPAHSFQGSAWPSHPTGTLLSESAAGPMAFGGCG